MVRDKLQLQSKIFRPADFEAITGWSKSAQRDLQRRGYNFGETGGQWLSASSHDLAKMLFVRTLRDAGLELSEAWQRANDEVIGNIVFHAIVDHDAVDRFPDGQDFGSAYEKRKPKLAMEFAAADGFHVAGGDYFVFGPTVPAGAYASIAHAIDEADRAGNGPHLVFHVVSLRAVSKVLAERAGQLAYIDAA